MKLITEYQSILDNTVSAENQVAADESVKFSGDDKDCLKILFLGNSITWVPKHVEIGWCNDCGMAASCEANDYVHKLMNKVYKEKPNTDYCIAQLAAWEKAYWDENYLKEHYSSAVKYDADIIIVRIVENVPADKLEEHSFYDAYGSMLDFFNPNGDKKIIITTGFWHAGKRDDIVTQIANERNLSLVTLGDLGDDKSMKAIGLFDHSGVASHPGDKGMEEIANRIWAVLSKMIKE